MELIKVSLTHVPKDGGYQQIQDSLLATLLLLRLHRVQNIRQLQEEHITK